ncbi:hypothetical protein Tco_0664356 [Tanacetum coccineum]
MDANKKINLDNPLYLNESKIMSNIIQNHPLRFSIAASSLVPWIYLGGSSILYKKMDQRMVPFFFNTLDFTLELRSTSNSKTTGLVQPWQTLGKIFPRFLTTARDKYHNLEDDAMVKNLFNLGKHKDNVGMKIPSWMITDEMKLTDHYWMYAVVFGVDVPTTQSHPIESTQGTHRTISAPRSPNHKMDEGESGVDNVENVEVNSSILRQDDTQSTLETSLEPKSKNECPVVEITAEVQPVNINEEEEKSVKDDYELKRREKGKHERENLRSEISSQINDAISNHIPSQVDSSVRNYMSSHILHVHLTQATPTSVQEQQQQLYLTMRDNPQLPSAIHPRDQDDPHDDAHPEGENDEDEIPTEKVSQELMDEMSHTVDEAKLRKVVDEMNEILVSSHPQRPTPVVQSCQRDPKAPTISLIIKTYWELGHEKKFITNIVARRANGSLVSITKSDYKNLNKNDIEDMYLQIVNHKLGVESYQQKVNLTAPIITFPGIENYKVFSIVFEPMYSIIYKNIKKEKRVMRHQEVYKFCDATLKRVLEGLKSYNNDVKHGYVT